jgi:hypothetical protein
MQLSEQSLELVSVFKKASKNFRIVYSLQGSLKILKPFAIYRKYWFNLKGL